MSEFKRVYNLTYEFDKELNSDERLRSELNAVWLKLTDEGDYHGDCPEEFNKIAESEGEDGGFDTADDYVADYGGIYVMFPLKGVEEYGSPQELIEEYRDRLISSPSLKKYFGDEFKRENLSDAYIAGNILDVSGFEFEAPTAIRRFRAKFKTIRHLFSHCSKVGIFDTDNAKALLVCEPDSALSESFIVGPSPVEIERIYLTEGQNAADEIPSSYDERYVTNIRGGVIPVSADDITSLLKDVISNKGDGNSPPPDFIIADGPLFVTICDADEGRNSVIVEKTTIESLIRLIATDDVIRLNDQIMGELIVYESEARKNSPDGGSCGLDSEVDYIEAFSPTLRKIVQGITDGEFTPDEDGIIQLPSTIHVTLK